MATVHVTPNTRYRGRAAIPVAVWALVSASEISQHLSDAGFGDVAVYMAQEELPNDWTPGKGEAFPDLGIDRMIWFTGVWRGVEGDLTLPDGLARVDVWADSEVAPANVNPSGGQSQGTQNAQADLPAPAETTATVEAFPPDQPQNAQQARAMLIAAWRSRPGYAGATPNETVLANLLALSRAETDFGLGKYADPVTHKLRQIVVPGNWGALAESAERPPAAGELWTHLVAAGDRNAKGEWFTHLFRAYDSSLNGALDFLFVVERSLGIGTAGKDWPTSVDELAQRLQAGHYYAGPIAVYTANLDRANAANCKAGVECLEPSATSSSSAVAPEVRKSRAKRALWVALPLLVLGGAAAVAAEVLE